MNAQTKVIKWLQRLIDSKTTSSSPEWTYLTNYAKKHGIRF